MIRYHSITSKRRVETGPVRFDDDLAGVFIRGDNAMHFAHLLKSALALLPKADRMQQLTLNGPLNDFARLLESCKE